MTNPRWIDLDGAVNVRDVGGLPTEDGRKVQPHRLIRSASLQHLSERDVTRLVDDIGVRSVADLRSGVEVEHEGPGPLTELDDVEIVHLSLFAEAGERTDAADTGGETDGDGADRPVILPWQTDERTEVEKKRGAMGVYLSYLERRPDSVLAALRLVAGSPGATIVHCAAGKDRTGTVVAIALAEVGVTRDAIVADYARSAEHIEAIFAYLHSTRTYVNDMVDADPHKHAPKAVTMERLLDAAEQEFGGFPAWLRQHGWTDHDAAALRRKLLDDDGTSTP